MTSRTDYSQLFFPVMAGVVALGLLLCGTSCSDSSSFDTEGEENSGGAGDVGRSDSSQEASDGELNSRLDATLEDTSTAHECDQAESEEECLEMNCGVWTSSRVVTIDENGDCQNGATEEYCILPQGGDGVPTWWWRKSGDDALVVMMPGAFNRSQMEPWRECTGADSEPDACQCRDD